MPMEPDNTFITIAKEIVRVVKTGGGILGKSAGLIGLLILCFIVAIFRLHDDQSILWALGGIAFIYFLWYGPILWLVNKFPEKAFLEGPEWMEHHQQVLMAAKGQPVLASISAGQSAPDAVLTAGLENKAEAPSQ